MKRLSLAVRLSFGTMVVLGLLVYLAVVDLGVNAGRIHRGVAVRRVEIGGLTPPEAETKLRAAAEEMKSHPVVFKSDVPGIGPFEALPADLGWQTRPADAAAAAYRIGRSDGIWRSVEERIRAWFGGVDVGWLGRLDSAKANLALDQLDREALDAGYRLKRGKMLRRLRNAITDWPDRKPSYRIPLAQISG